MLEPLTGDDANRAITVNLRDCVQEPIVGGNLTRVTANVPLGDRVWERITRVLVNMMSDDERPLILPTTTANVLRIRFSANVQNIDRFEVEINPPPLEL